MCPEDAENVELACGGPEPLELPAVLVDDLRSKKLLNDPKTALAGDTFQK